MVAVHHRACSKCSFYGDHPLASGVFGRKGITYSLRSSLPHVVATLGLVRVPYAELDSILGDSAVYRTIRREVKEAK